MEVQCYQLNITMRVNDIGKRSPGPEIRLDLQPSGPIYATAMLEGDEIGYAFFSPHTEQGVLLSGNTWVDRAHRGQGVAKAMYESVRKKGFKIRPGDHKDLEEARAWARQAVMEDLFSESDLSEGTLQNLWRLAAAAAGAVAAGGYAMYQDLPAADASANPPYMVRAATPTGTANDQGYGSADVDAMAKAASSIDTGTHPNYPTELAGLDQADADTRVSTFTTVFLPYVDSVNNEIQRQRKTLVRILNLRPEMQTKEQQDWLTSMMNYYKASNSNDLLLRVDIVPRSLALAQAAVESGWAQDDLAQQANAFYGQKHFSKTGSSIAGSKGEKYSAFDSPMDSVRAYMRNLNTNPAYSGFRMERAKMRAAGKAPTGTTLVGQLQKYSTRGKDYTKQISNLIRNRFNNIDIASN